MLLSVFTRGASAGALTLAFSTWAVAQQSLPTIDVGGQRRAAAARTPAQRGQAASIGSVGQPSTAVPLNTSGLRLEPKTPTEAYIVRNADSATKMDVPIKEIPQSIEVIPRQVLVDQQVTNLKDAVSNASGVLSNNLEGLGAQFHIRGFRQNFIFRNALSLSQFTSMPMLVDTANVERVEVLKGPSSILFGRADPGGVINIVTKQPLDEPLYRVDQQIGSYDHYRTQWDVSAPIAEVPGLAYRVSGAYQNNGSFRQFQGGRRAFLAPVVRYSPSAWTEFTAEAELLTSRIQQDLGLPSGSLFGPLIAPLPHTRSFQEANDPKDTFDRYLVSYNFRQNLNEDWKVTNRFLYQDSRSASNMLSNAGFGQFAYDTGFNPEQFFQMNRQTQFQDFKRYNLSTNIDLSGKFEALGAKHNFLFGLDYANLGYDYVYNFGFDNYPINIYAPVYGTVPNSAFYDSVIGRGYKSSSSVVARQKGMYVQDYITFDRLHLMIGARYDIADLTRGKSRSNFGLFPVLASDKELAIAARLRQPTTISTGWSPRVGVVFDILPELSAYASYSRSFGPQAAFDAKSVALPPERALQWEVGFKAQPLPGLLATLAFYQITKSNVATALFGTVGVSQLAGLQRSRGVEFDLIGALTDRMTVIANYAYINAKVIDDNAPNRLNPFGLLDSAVFGAQGGFLGNHLEFAPRHSGKLFLTYDFGDNGLGFRAGGGVTASSNWWGDLENTFVMPGFARLDGFASYTAELYGHRVTAQLNLQNINNVRYFDAVDDTFNYNAAPKFRIPARPFTAVGALSFKW
ncbi:TonB-dependent siderophore receptor [Methylocystis sp. JR02]|uniref:TonB-dependent siderophore receptor n=1 Tax=Methylocystis sp. JR02 TaxID=3046284 RepID=UPI0024BAFD01|nr:TonB-dependent siderophore receptor [Methylocystis sp. JR02]MDJ0449932.1 TonB-dependent siderophore receptor [Methylocystis sp. JR02]